MVVSIHQPHFFPWLGYLDKMAKADKFVLLDEAQLTERSNMYRNKFVSLSGTEKKLGISYQKEKHLELPFSEIKINKNVNWQREQKNFIVTNYRKAPFFDEIWSGVESIFTKDFDTIYEVDFESISFFREIFDIKTPIVFQSTLKYDREMKKNDMVLGICIELGADRYLSGNGARKYMDDNSFLSKGIDVKYQNFTCPVYNQVGGHEFVPNASSLDILFNLGAKKSKEMFWDNVEKNREFE